VTALWFFAPRKSPRVAFTEFTNSGGWSSEVLSLLIGQISAVYASVSSEGVVNMSEEIHVRLTILDSTSLAKLISDGVGC